MFDNQNEIYKTRISFLLTCDCELFLLSVVAHSFWSIEELGEEMEFLYSLDMTFWAFETIVFLPMKVFSGGCAMLCCWYVFKRGVSFVVTVDTPDGYDQPLVHLLGEIGIDHDYQQMLEHILHLWHHISSTVRVCTMILIFIHLVIQEMLTKVRVMMIRCKSTSYIIITRCVISWTTCDLVWHSPLVVGTFVIWVLTYMNVQQLQLL